ncbi:TATA box-binding protein-associated factor RNA polymerase I subunit B-like [Rhipicephalus microplus]|uniref:TATA box-binding protein-associated factor RNA polymerase I subunit B-like n=1 Tax=Rhipicephalus microplus TaxID=6941 RepID=UPI003F6C5DCA
MVVCASCGGEDFDEVSGLYYCTECNTQSQEVRVEQVDDEGAAPPPHVGRASPRRKETGNSTPRERKHPYPTNELFNAILVRQVDALVLLGASAELRGVVCRLWMDYLVKLEAVSRVEDDEWTPRIGVVNRWSDLRTVEELIGASETSERKRKKLQKALFGSGVKTRLTSRSCRYRKRLKNRCDVARAPNLDSDCEFEDELLATASEGEQASEDDVEDFRSTAAKEYLERVLRRGVDLHDKKIGRETEVTVVTLQRLLCLLYLGVLITGDPILLTDILRWARDGHLPYLHVLKLLPEDAKLWGQQWRTFVRLTMPTIDELAAQAAHLAHFLGMRSELRQPPLLPIVMRLVADLNLPLEFVNVCEEVLCTHPKMVPSWEVPPNRAAGSVPLFSPVCEVRAAAVLLLALKLTLGLNGSREVQLSRAVEELASRHPEANLFVWSRWEKHLRARLLLLRSSCYGFEPEDLDDIRDVGVLFRHPDSAPVDRSMVTKALREGMKKSFWEMHRRELIFRQVPATSFAVTPAVRFFCERTPVSSGLRAVLEESFLDKDVTYLTRATHGIASVGGWAELCQSVPEFIAILGEGCDQYWTVALKRVYDLKYSNVVQHSLPKTFLFLLEFMAAITHCHPKELYRDLLRIEAVFLR